MTLTHSPGPVSASSGAAPILCEREADVTGLPHDTGNPNAMHHHHTLTAILLLTTSPAFAGTECVDLQQRLSNQQMQATGLATLTTQQLAALNRILCDQAVATPASTTVVADPADYATAAVASHGIADTPTTEVEEEVAVEATTAATGALSYIGLDNTRITSQVKGTVSGWEPGTEFPLSNGQLWKVLKGTMTLRAPVKDPEVVLVPGIAGRWFLQVDEDLPKARVYRVD